MSLTNKILPREKLLTLLRERALLFADSHKIISPRGPRSDWMFDVRSVLLDPEALSLITELLWERLEKYYPFQVGGQETAALPLISALVLKSVQVGKPISGFYIRKSRKKYDLQKNIEGTVTADPIVLVDDLVNSGTTLLKQLDILEKEGLTVAHILTCIQFRPPETYAHIVNRVTTFDALYNLTEFNVSLQNNTQNRLVPKPWFTTCRYGRSPNATYTFILPKSTPLLDENYLYWGTDDRTFWALRQNDGEEIWRFKVGLPTLGKSIYSSPALHNGLVHFGSYDGNVYALEAKTEQVAWKFMEADWVGSSPAIAPDLNVLFIGLEFGLLGKMGGIVALDLTSGKKKWEYRMRAYVHSTPAYSKRYNVVAVGGNDQTLYLFNAKTGSLLWEFKTGGDIRYAPVIDETRGIVFFGSLDGVMYGLSIKTGEQLFSYTTEAGIYASPLVVDDTIYIASLDKNLYAVDINSSALQWKVETGGRIFCTPVCIEGNIFVGSNDGRLYEIDPKTGTILTFFPTTERIVNPPVYNPKTKRFFLTTFSNELYCLERNPETPLEKTRDKLPAMLH